MSAVPRLELVVEIAQRRHLHLLVLALAHGKAQHVHLAVNRVPQHQATRIGLDQEMRTLLARQDGTHPGTYGCGTGSRNESRYKHVGDSKTVSYTTCNPPLFDGSENIACWKKAGKRRYGSPGRSSQWENEHCGKAWPEVAWRSAPVKPNDSATGRCAYRGFRIHKT